MDDSFESDDDLEDIKEVENEEEDEVPEEEASPNRKRRTTMAPGKIQDSLKDNIHTQLEEMKMELEASRYEICKQANDHIQDQDHILTYGFSSTVVSFL